MKNKQGMIKTTIFNSKRNVVVTTDNLQFGMTFKEVKKFMVPVLCDGRTIKKMKVLFGTCDICRIRNTKYRICTFSKTNSETSCSYHYSNPLIKFGDIIF